MTEFTRDNFICNGLIKAGAEFEECFGQHSKYIYEVFRVQAGIPVFIEDHLDRLWKTVELENIKLPFSRNTMLADIVTLIQANPTGEGNIKIFISLPVHSPIIRLVYFTPHQYPSTEQFNTGVAVSLFRAERGNPNAKVMDVALRSATDVAKKEEAVYEVLLVDRDGFITEGSRSNVFFIQNNRLITPPIESVLQGITRKQIMQICDEESIPVSEQKVHYNELNVMDAAFISGTSRRVLPVGRIAGLAFNSSNQVIRQLQQLFELRVTKYLLLHKNDFSSDLSSSGNQFRTSWFNGIKMF
ncbi:MAG: aminotransferase class IV [Bacteroidales bacterium]|nr:aminotransferase class IV [Bacteroidales bacterium]